MFGYGSKVFRIFETFRFKAFRLSRVINRVDIPLSEYIRGCAMA